MTTLLALWAWLQSAAGTTAVLLPSLLAACSSLAVGLTNYPKAGTVLSYIMKALNLLSLVTHADSPGTLKMPLTQSQDPHGLQKPGTGPVGLAMIAILTAGSLFISGCACTNPQNAGRWYCKAETALIDCSTAAAQPAMQAALTDVEAALSGTSINWIALAESEAKYGIGVVACVIEKLDAGAASNSPLHANAKTYFAARKLKLKK